MIVKERYLCESDTEILEKIILLNIAVEEVNEKMPEKYTPDLPVEAYNQFYKAMNDILTDRSQHKLELSQTCRDNYVREYTFVLKKMIDRSLDEADRDRFYILSSHLMNADEWKNKSEMI